MGFPLKSGPVILPTDTAIVPTLIASPMIQLCASEIYPARSLSSGSLEALPATAYQVSTTENRVSVIKETAERAFGQSLKRRTSRSFELTRNREVAQWGVSLPADGLARVPHVPWATVDGSDRQGILLDFEGGVAMGIGNVQPACARSAPASD